ncbi:hypothetical protein D3C80_1676160 [compost metagenome]
MNAPRLSMMRPATLTLICWASSSTLLASTYCFCSSPAWLSRRKSLGKAIAWLSRTAASFSLRWAISLFSSSWMACSFSGCSLMVVVFQIWRGCRHIRDLRGRSNAPGISGGVLH